MSAFCGHSLLCSAAGTSRSTPSESNALPHHVAQALRSPRMHYCPPGDFMPQLQMPYMRSHLHCNQPDMDGQGRAPAMVGADDTVVAIDLRDPALVQRRAAVRAYVGQAVDLAGAVAEQQQLLAHNLNAHRLVCHLLADACNTQTLFLIHSQCTMQLRD